MIGGIIGDLAASTYLRDKNTFYCQLFDISATLSEFGIAILASAKYLYDNPRSGQAGNQEEFTRILSSYLSSANKRISDITDLYNSEILSQGDYKTILPRRSGTLLCELAVAGWFMDSDEDRWTDVVAIFEPWEKEEGYARILMPKMIRLLRSGYTKDETYQMLNPVFKDVRHHWDWRNGTSTLCLLMRAWNCFYNSFDFGSAIHNAVRDMPENPRLMASVTGMIASAMYGHGYYYIKQKYSGGQLNQRFLQIPERIATAYMDEFRVIRVHEKWQHIFFKKNDALTNVERLHFMPIQSRYEGHVITAEQRRRILRAFVTGWEDRFGFYLDNGFVYLYRSHYLLGRFKIIPCGEDSFRSVNVSYTQEFPSGLNFDECLECAMHSADSECLQSFRYYRFSWGNPTDSVNPYPKDDRRAMFWDLEKQFYETAMSRWDEWIKSSRESLRHISDKRLINHAKVLGRESFAILFYIEMVVGKFNPYDPCDWVTEYGM